MFNIHKSQSQDPRIQDHPAHVDSKRKGSKFSIKDIITRKKTK